MLICDGLISPLIKSTGLSLLGEFKWFEQVFEKLGPSLYDFLRKNNYRSFPIDLVREIGRQLLDCVVIFLVSIFFSSAMLLLIYSLNVTSLAHH